MSEISSMDVTEISRLHQMGHRWPPLVSIVIPCYNAEKWIAETIESVKRQTYPKIEIIVVNDGSSDKSMDVVSKFDRVKIIDMGVNSGACAAVDAGFAAATGEYACMLAADDCYVNETHLKHQVDVMEQTNADWSYTTVFTSGPTVHSAQIIKTKWLFHQYFDDIILKFPPLCKILIRERNPVNSSSMMFRMSTYRREKLSWSCWGKRSVCDEAIITRMLARWLKAVPIRKIGVFYRVHQAQISNNPDFIQEKERVHKQ